VEEMWHAMVVANENARKEENQASTIIVVSDRRAIVFKVVQIKPIKQSSCTIKASCYVNC